MWKIPSLFHQLTKKNRKWSVLFIHTPLNPIQPQQKKKHHTHPPKFTSQGLPLKTCFLNSKTRPSPTFAPFILFGGGWGRALRSHFSGAFPSLLACCSTSGGALVVQVPRANMKHPPRRKTTTKVPSEPPQRAETKLCPSYICEILLWGTPINGRK